VAIALARTASGGTLAASPPGPQRHGSKRHGASASAGHQQQHGKHHSSGHSQGYGVHSHKLQHNHQGSGGSSEGTRRRSDKAGRSRRRQPREAPATMALDSVVLGAMVQG
jgi:hypothetical protein